MFFTVSKICFSAENKTPLIARDLHSLVEKIRARFRVCVTAYPDTHEIAIAITSLALTEEALNKQIDQVIEFCESSGLGRVISESTLLDDVDSIATPDDD